MQHNEQQTLIDCIPIKLKTWIESQEVSKSERRKLYRIAQYSINKIYRENIPFDEAIDISSMHWREQIGTNYNQWLSIFKRDGILTTDGKYFYHKADNIKGKCLKWLYNPDIIFSDPAFIEYTVKTKNKFQKDPIVRQTVKLLSDLRLDIDKRSIIKYTKETITFEVVKSQCRINQNIPFGKYKYHNSNVRHEIDRIRARAKELVKDVVLYKNDVYLVDKEKFIWRKVFEKRNHLAKDLIRLKNIRKRNNIFCNRNETNTRLDTNLTSILSTAISQLTLDGQKLVSIDLKNSQFIILAALMESAIDLINEIVRFIYANYDKLPDSPLKQKAKPLFDWLTKAYQTIEDNIVGKINTYNNTFTEGAENCFFPLYSLFGKLTIEDYKIIKVYVDNNSINVSPTSPIIYLSIFQYSYCLFNVTKFLDLERGFYGVTISKPVDYEDFQKCTKTGVFYETFADKIWADVYQFWDTGYDTYSLSSIKKKIKEYEQGIETAKSFEYEYKWANVSKSNKIETLKERIKAHKELYKDIRADAKSTMFLTCFSSHLNHSEDKKRLKKHYPSIVYFMDKFKQCMTVAYKHQGAKDYRQKGKASLAVMLQTIEAKIFIDGILSNLLKRNYRVFSKHDSIICRECDVGQVKRIVQRQLDNYLGNGCYQIKIER